MNEKEQTESGHLCGNFAKSQALCSGCGRRSELRGYFFAFVPTKLQRGFLEQPRKPLHKHKSDFFRRKIFFSQNRF